MIPVPGHPYASYTTSIDAVGRLWILCACSFCGDTWRHQCNNPARVNDWVYTYAVTHGHGVTPQR